MPRKGWRGTYKTTKTASEFLQKQSLKTVRMAYKLVEEMDADPDVPKLTKFNAVLQLLPYSVPRLQQVKALVGTTRAQELYDKLFELRNADTGQPALLEGGETDESLKERVEQSDSVIQHTGTDEVGQATEASSGDSFTEGWQEP